MRRPIPLAVWFMVLATASQGAAALWAVTHNESRALVMAVSASVFLVGTVALYLKRPVARD